jgi:hypothetical protein
MKQNANFIKLYYNLHGKIQNKSMKKNAFIFQIP